jgi:hypothetical protein
MIASGSPIWSQARNRKMRHENRFYGSLIRSLALVTFPLGGA